MLLAGSSVAGVTVITARWGRKKGKTISKYYSFGPLILKPRASEYVIRWPQFCPVVDFDVVYVQVSM